MAASKFSQEISIPWNAGRTTESSSRRQIWAKPGSSAYRDSATLGSNSVRSTHRQYFVSEASFYRLLKAHDLITGPAREQSEDQIRSRLHTLGTHVTAFACLGVTE